ncbi:MAG: hypothetical protein JWO03_3939 [Bacteroidetes bacterium]|nr:hypothetical protein [Bacteroidota bacterium]
MERPAIQLILDYKTFFGADPTNDRLSLVRHICKRNLLVEIAGLNYRLKPNDTIFVDESFDRQRKELDWFTKNPDLYRYYSQIAARYTKSVDDYPNIFNRPACLFALEEISNSDIPEIEDFNFTKPEEWESILKYLLAVNFHITQIKKEKDGVQASFEKVNPKLIRLNELRVKTDPLFTLYRGYRLITYFARNPTYAKHLAEYFNKTYGMDYQFFLSSILHMYKAKVNAIPENNFLFKLGRCQDSRFLDALSKRHREENALLLLGIRKSPFIKLAPREYIMGDNAFLLEKTYYQFINDFWFDCIKQILKPDGKNLISHQRYFADVGVFFEEYLREILTNSFKNYVASVLLTFDQLKLTGAQGEFELCDIYFRADRKVIIGQAKATGIYDEAKYGGDIGKLYKEDRAKFFKNFGVDQVVKSIKDLSANINRLDTTFPSTGECEVYPCIVVNDKALQTALMNHVFNLRFQELITGFSDKNLKVHPLTLIHVMDLENVEEALSSNPQLIWNLLDNTIGHPAFLMPFYTSVYKLLPHISYPAKLLTAFTELFDKHNSQFKFSLTRITNKLIDRIKGLPNLRKNGLAV